MILLIPIAKLNCSTKGLNQFGSSTIPLAGSNPTLEHSSLTAKTPKSTADREDKEPMKEPMGVLDTAQITTLDSPINWLKGYLS